MNSPYVIEQFKWAVEVCAKCGGSTVDPEIASFLSSYLVVMLSGVYEDCIEHLLAQRAARGQDNEVTSYISKSLHETFRNPTFGALVGVLGKFSDQYAQRMREGVQERDAQALDSIVNNKNLIAHGRRSQLTVNEVVTFHGGVVRIFELLEGLLA
jgi:hypothetical protein